MKPKKGFFILTIGLFVSLLIVSYSFVRIFKSPEKNKDKNIKIGVTLYEQNDPFIASISSNLEKKSKMMEINKDERITLNIISADGSQIKQNDQVDKFIEQGYDVICVNTVDRTASSIIIDSAKRANIPIIFFNREPVEEDLNRWDKLYYVGALASVTGTLQGEILTEAILKDIKVIDKNNDGVIQYVLLEGEPGHQDASLRTEYCINTVQQAGIDLEKLSNESAYWKRDKANMKVRQWLDLYGDNIEVIISNNDDMALGAIDVLKEVGNIKWPLIVGVDATDSARKEIEDGYLYGTVNINASQQADIIMKLAYSLAWNMSVDREVEIVNGKYVYSTQDKVIK